MSQFFDSTIISTAFDSNFEIFVYKMTKNDETYRIFSSQKNVAPKLNGNEASAEKAQQLSREYKFAKASLYLDHQLRQF